jgi:FtsP/CotA-like multicopper oxidase with cupredoxin domain
MGSMTNPTPSADAPEPHPPASSEPPYRSMLGLSRRGMLARAVALGGSIAAVGALQRRGGATPQPASIVPSLGMQEGHGEHGSYAATPVPWEPAELIEPEERRSVDGVLSTTLRAAYSYQDVGGYRLFLRSYEGMVPGPTLRVQPGDLLKIEMINDLPPNRDPAPVNTDHPHQFNTINFHAHGTHVSPGGIADNVLRSMEPGGTYPIEIEFPADHTRGTYWYHPHHHGSADIQVASGMVGALIVDGDFADLPEIAAARERVLVFGQIVFDQHRTVEEFELVWSETATRFLTVNGQREPIIRLRPGEVQRWRLVNAGYQDDIRLNLADHELHAIAYDGISLDRIETMTELLLAPGQRADILIAAEPGSYQLAALPNDQGYPSANGPLATVVIEGDPLPMTLPASLPAAPLSPIADDEITGSREVVFSVHAPEVDAAGHYSEFDFLVDGELFDPERIDHRIKLGAVEEWTIVNAHIHDHVFHIHINPFLVTEINGEPVEHPVWRDTVIVPRLGSIVFRSRFIDFPGKYVLHCHMMNHEALGMMQLIEVSD